MKKIKINTATEIKAIMTKLRQANRDLERLQFAYYGEKEPTSISDDELLKTARSLSFIWNSRKSFVDESLLADPGWVILLTLKITELTNDKIQISSLCIDSGAPATTALRWIKLLESKSLVKIEPDLHDRRRRYVALTKEASDQMGRYLQNIRNFVSTRDIIF